MAGKFHIAAGEVHYRHDASRTESQGDSTRQLPGLRCDVVTCKREKNQVSAKSVGSIHSLVILVINVKSATRSFTDAERNTYHNRQRARPRRHIAIVVQIHLRLRTKRVDVELRHVTGGTVGTAEVLEAKDDLEDLGRGVGHEVEAQATVRAISAEKHVVLDGTRRIDGIWVGEVVRLEDTCECRTYEAEI